MDFYVDKEGFIYDDKIHVVRVMPEEDKVFLLKQISIILEEKKSELDLYAEGSEAEIYKYKNYAVKIQQVGLLKDGQILRFLQDSSLFPKLYLYGMSFMVCEFIEGVPFFELEENPELYKNHFFAKKEFRNTLNEIKKVLIRGIQPRDCKPRNFILEKDSGRIKLIDVGEFKKIQNRISDEHFIRIYMYLQSEIQNLKRIKNVVKQKGSS